MSHPKKFTTVNNRSFGKCPKCGAKCSIQRTRVSRDQGQTWILQTIHQCWSSRRNRCTATIEEQPWRNPPPKKFLE